MEGFCRGCLIKYNEPTDLIQYTEKNRRLFVYSTGLQVKRNDIFTFQLCKDCNNKMKLACDFKKLCRTSDKRIKNYHIKEAGDNMDFCTFLKNSDDALTLRFPLIAGSCTPANQMCKDDDNESTCTSIRNFMTDILQGEEMPDTEASIIREVIKEEADVTDDSLDSHWLQDDLSIATDFRLDFSLSPFSTPRLTNNDHCYTPKRLSDQNEQERINYYTSKEIMEKPDQVEDIIKNSVNTSNSDVQNNQLGDNNYFKTEEPLNDCMDVDQNVNNDDLLQSRYPNYYKQRDNLEESVPIQITNDNLITGKVDTIDKNLEEALKNQCNKEFSLDDLLVSPQALPGISAPSTPTINNILFGDKLDLNSENGSNGPGVGQCLENFEHVEDIESIEEFLNRNNETLNDLYYVQNSEEAESDNQLNNDQVTKKKPKIDKWLVEDKFDIEKSYCKLCSKQFKNNKALSIHSSKYHKIRIINPHKNVYKYKPRVCEICGKTFRDSANFCRHIAQHKKDSKEYKCDLCPIKCTSQAKLDAHIASHKELLIIRKETGKENGEQYRCDRCPVECTSQAKLDAHIATHRRIYKQKETSKLYVCNICGAVSKQYSTHRIHKLRHAKKYTMTCDECGKGFFRSSDLNDHKRIHTGERPFECEYCSRAFSRRDALNTHIKHHTDDRPFQCDHCEKSFLLKKYLMKHTEKSKKCKKLRDKLVQAENSKVNPYVVQVEYAKVNSSVVQEEHSKVNSAVAHQEYTKVNPDVMQVESSES